MERAAREEKLGEMQEKECELQLERDLKVIIKNKVGDVTANSNVTRL